jgi:hypothetical protein
MQNAFEVQPTPTMSVIMMAMSASMMCKCPMTEYSIVVFSG